MVSSIEFETMRFYAVLLMALCSVHATAQWDWESDNSQKLAKKFKDHEKYRDDFFLFSDFQTNITFDFDSETDEPVAIEEVRAEVLSFLDYERFVWGAFQDDNREVSGLRGLNANGNKYEIPYAIRDYQSSGIFHQDGQQIVFRLPSSTYGHVQGFTYTTTTSDVKYFTSVYLRKPLYMESGTVRVEIPDWLELEIVEKNFDGFQIEKTESGTKGGTVIEYKMSEADQMVNEPGAPGPTYYEPHLVFVFKSYEDKSGTYPLLGSTDEQYEWYRSLVDEVDEDDSDLEELVEELTSGLSNDLAKVEAIFYWIQDNVRYIAFEDGIAGFQPESAINVCNNRYGDCKGMANLAKHMLTIAGYDARLTWVGTRRIAYDYSLPSLAVDNHMICTVFLNGEKYFLDPTETYIALNDYAHRIQGRQVLIENGDEYLLEKVPEFDHVHNKAEVQRNFTLKDGKLVGHSVETYQGESKTTILRGYNGLRSDKREEALVSFVNEGDKNLSASNIKTSDLNNRDEKVKIEYDYTLANHIVDIETEVLIELDYDQQFYYFRFEEDRETDYYFPSKYNKTCQYTFTVPPGYRIKHVPAGLSKKTDDYSIDVKVEVSGNQVVVTRTIIVFNGVIKKENQEQWNKDMGALRTYYNDYLVLENLSKI